MSENADNITNAQKMEFRCLLFKDPANHRYGYFCDFKCDYYLLNYYPWHLHCENCNTPMPFTNYPMEWLIQSGHQQLGPYCNVPHRWVDWLCQQQKWANYSKEEGPA